MTSATTTPVTETSRPRGAYLAIFAGVLLATIGFFNLIDGIAAITRSHVYIGSAHYVVGDLRTWGWVVLILSVLQLLAAIGVLSGNQLARWTAVGLVVINAVAQMLFLPAYPFWALTVIAMDVVALWGLCVYGSRENLEA